MRFFCCAISYFVAFHFVFCFMPFREPGRLYCSFPSPLLFIRFVKGEVTIKFRIGCVMRVLFNRFIGGRLQLSLELGVLCAYCLFGLLREGVQLSSELGVLCAYCLFGLLREGVQSISPCFVR